jgi:hypothetical protein
LHIVSVKLVAAMASDLVPVHTEVESVYGLEGQCGPKNSQACMIIRGLTWLPLVILHRSGP